MRIALITLALTALVFIGSIVYSLAGKNWLSLSTQLDSTKKVETPIEIESLKYQIKNEEKINELMKKVESLSAWQDWIDRWSIDTATSTGKISIPISGKFLSQVMPTLEFSLVENSWIYELLIFDKTVNYSTYTDSKQWIKAQPLSIKYDVFLKNMKAIGSDVYTINETKTFPFRSFYVNSPKTDTLVRLVIEVEWQTIVLEVPKTRFEAFKKLLLKK
jgi:hypothetical protein